MTTLTKPTCLTTLSLPLMMFGKNGNHWHEEGKPVYIRYISGYTRYKTGKRKDEEKPIYDWKIKTTKKKVLTGYEGVFKSGKNKGLPKPVYETKEMPVLSTGFYPTVNHIYMNTKAGRKLKPIAENHLLKWRSLTETWKQENGWETQQAPVKVIVEMVFYLPDGHKDTHNAKKLLLDALETVIHTDDYYLLDRTIDFTIDNDHPRVELQFSIPDSPLPL